MRRRIRKTEKGLCLFLTLLLCAGSFACAEDAADGAPQQTPSVKAEEKSEARKSAEESASASDEKKEESAGSSSERGDAAQQSAGTSQTEEKESSPAASDDSAAVSEAAAGSAETGNADVSDDAGGSDGDESPAGDGGDEGPADDEGEEDDAEEDVGDAQEDGADDEEEQADDAGEADPARDDSDGEDAGEAQDDADEGDEEDDGEDDGEDEESSPHAGDISIGVQGETSAQDGVLVIRVRNPRESVTFYWNEVEGATRYRVQILDENGNELFSDTQEATSISLPAQTFGQGICTIRVTALLEDDAVWGTLIFALSGGDGGFGGFGHFGRSGRSRGHGGGSGGEGEDAGFRVTPGVALTSSHVSGTKDMRLFGAVAITWEEGDMKRLILDGTALSVKLDGGKSSFTVSAAGRSALALTPTEAGASWTVGADALKTLQKSGVQALILALEDGQIQIDTDFTPAGRIYDQLRAQGHASRDFLYILTSGGIRATVGEDSYDVNEAGEFVPVL